MLTILKNEAADGGLEVRDLEGSWHEAPVVEDGFIVNIGDLLMRWTNDRFISTLHRVANPIAWRRCAAPVDRLLRRAELRFGDRVRTDLPGSR